MTAEIPAAVILVVTPAETAVAVAGLQAVTMMKLALHPDKKGEAVPAATEEAHQAIVAIHPELQAGADHLRQAVVALPQMAEVHLLQVRDQRPVQVLKKAVVKNKQIRTE